MQWPGSAGCIVHGDQGTRKARVGKAGKETGAHARFLWMIQQPTQHLDNHYFEQSISKQALAATHTINFREQEFKRLVQAGTRDSGRQIKGGSARAKGLFAPPSKSRRAQVKSEPSLGGL